MKPLIALTLFLFSPTLFDITDRIIVADHEPVELCQDCVIVRWLGDKK